jgi:hypothetical protein
VEIADGASHNTVGGGNTISGNGNDGVLIWNAGTKFNTVQTNYIGTDGTGTNNLGNSQNGVEIANGASYNTVGNGNTISGNGADGVLIGNAGTNNNTVTTNYIGTDQTGTTPLPNGEDGVEIANGASFNTVGNGNIISGNALDGVRITDAGTNTNAVTTNNIRTDQTGTNPLPNGEDGVDLANGASFNTVGNGNTISGNAFDGVEISDTGTNNNTVTANNIGMDQTGSNPLPNGDDGVEIANGASFNTVGNGNTISANTLNGVHISGGTTTWNKIQGNKIGLQSGGSSALGNGQSGVLIDGNANGNLIGSNSNDPSQSNSIEYNTLDGVTIIDGTPNGTVNNAVELNSIYRNQRLGINLGDGASLLPNQANNPASGPNHLQNFPTINEVSQAAGNTLISVYLHSASAATFHIEFYGSDGSDPLWYLQGQNYLGSTNVTADANGNVQFTYTVTGTVADITATATDSNGNTSEEFGVQLTDINGSVGAQSQTAAHSDLNITNANVFAIPQSSGVIKLTAEGLAPNNADILSRVHWTVRRNQTDIATGALPSIAPDPSDPTNPRKDQVSMNGVGSFNVICYLDANGNGQYDPGEEIKVFNLAEVGVTIIQNQSQATPNSTYFAAAPTRHGRDMKISSGNFSASFAMHYKDTVMLLGGGNNGMIGVSKIHLGWLQNGVSDTFKVTYADGNTESETLTAPATFPILDSTYPAAAGHPNAILTLPPGADPNLPNEEDASRDSVVGPDPGGAGQDRTVDSCDSPAVVFPNAFPGTGSAPISTAGTNSFKVYLVAYSDDYNSWYGAYQEVDWSALFSYTNPGGGAWMNNGSTVTVTQNTVFANPTDVQALNVTISGPRFWKSATMVSP